MFRFVLFIIVIFVSFGYKNILNFEKILWQADRKLTWQDFKGKVEKDTISDLTVARVCVKIDITYINDSENGIPKFKVESFMIPKLSWTIIDDAYNLEHEQLHFDLTEIYARKTRRAFDSLSKKKVKAYELYHKTFNNYYEQLMKAHKKYDSEVYFNVKRQNLWKNKIRNELKKMDSYKLLED